MKVGQSKYQVTIPGAGRLTRRFSGGGYRGGGYGSGFNSGSNARGPATKPNLPGRGPAVKGGVMLDKSGLGSPPVPTGRATRGIDAGEELDPQQVREALVSLERGVNSLPLGDTSNAVLTYEGSSSFGGGSTSPAVTRTVLPGYTGVFNINIYFKATTNLAEGRVITFASAGAGGPVVTAPVDGNGFAGAFVASPVLGGSSLSYEASASTGVTGSFVLFMLAETTELTE